MSFVAQRAPVATRPLDARQPVRINLVHARTATIGFRAEGSRHPVHLSPWQERNGLLCCTLSCENWRQAMAFAQVVSDCAETLNHHPELDVRFGRVDVRTWTHDAGGLTERDHALADAITAAFAAVVGSGPAG